MLEDSVPDVMLVDIGLPDMDGCAIARTAKGVRKLDTIFIALTGYSDQSTSTRIREAGFDAHLIKPLDFNCLERVLTEITASQTE